MLVLGLGGVSALAGRGVGDRLVVVARAALATHVVEEQLAELGAKAPGDVQYLDDADIADLQLSPEQGSRLKSVAAQAAAQP